MSGHPNILSYNKQARAADFMAPIALVLDEVAEVEDDGLFLRRVNVNGAAGVYPIFATNDPTKSAVVAKSNLATRISFFVISSSDSVMGFGRPGANKLPKVQGRGLIVSDARVTEFQSFVVDYPKPTDEGLRWLTEQVSAAEADVQIIEPVDEIAQMAEKIRGQWSEGMSGSAVARLLGLSQYGGSYKPRIDKVVAYLTSTLEAQNIGFSPKDMMYNEAIQNLATEISRLCGIPSYYLSADQNTSMTYANVIDERKQLVALAFQPYISAIEQRLSMDDISTAGHYVKFDLDSTFLRTEPMDRLLVLEKMLALGLITTEQAMEMEDLTPNGSDD